VAKKRNKAEKPKGEQAKEPEKLMIARIEEPMATPMPPFDLIELAKKLGWENGLVGDLNASMTIVRYPIRGHGFSVTLHELNGRCRHATQRFNEKGEPTYYSLDSGAVL
jgi:hypothetical protein